MAVKDFFFAGGGTGGHIYPAIAIAERLRILSPESRIHFFCSEKQGDADIISKSGFDFTALAAVAFSIRPDMFIKFCLAFLNSSRIVKKTMINSPQPVVVGIGGFVTGPVCWAAQKAGVPISIVNIDSRPGKANKLVSRWADNIFIQFAETADYFAKCRAKIHVTGCPLRESFKAPSCSDVSKALDLDINKKTLLITGASSGAVHINQAVCSLLGELDKFADCWQIVHLTGKSNIDEVKARYEKSVIYHRVLPWFDDMAGLLGCSDLVIGRSGAVSLAEYIAAKCPAICMPYPYHKDRHQYFNAEKLVDTGSAIVVDDLEDLQQRAQWLWQELEILLEDNDKIDEMKKGFDDFENTDAAADIAKILIGMET